MEMKRRGSKLEEAVQVGEMTEVGSPDSELGDRLQPCGGVIGDAMAKLWQSIALEIDLRNKLLGGYSMHILYFLLFILYLTAVLYTWITKDIYVFDFCHGYGFGLIVFILVLWCLIYNKLVRPAFLRACTSPCWERKSFETWSRYGEWILGSVAVIGFFTFLYIETSDDRRRLLSFGGWLTFAFVGFFFSAHPQYINWRTVLRGLGLQLMIGLLTIKWSPGRRLFECLGEKVSTFLEYAYTGAAFVYGDLLVNKLGLFAFQAMSVLYFLGMVMQILFYYGWLQKGCIWLGSLVQRVMGTTIIESVNAIMTLFIGMNEVPFAYQTYIKYLTRSEIHAIITACFAAVSGSMMAAYTSVGADPSLIITASSMAAPAALAFAKLFYPETQKSKTSSTNIVLHQSKERSVVDAACNGASMATVIIQGILANIVACISFIAFIDGILGYFGSLVGLPELTFEYSLAKVFVPLAWLMGVESSQCQDVAKLIGIKTTVNEFIAYKELGLMKRQRLLSPRSEAIATFALCGFANPGSVSIMLATLSGFCPQQRSNIISVSLRAFISASFTSFMSACIVGLLVPENGFQTMGTATTNLTSLLPS